MESVDDYSKKGYHISIQQLFIWELRTLPKLNVSCAGGSLDAKESSGPQFDKIDDIGAFVVLAGERAAGVLRSEIAPICSNESTYYHRCIFCKRPLLIYCSITKREGGSTSLQYDSQKKCGNSPKDVDHA